MFKLLKVVAKPVLDIIDKAIPDKDLKQKLKHEIEETLINNEHEIIEAAADIVRTEAASKHWLAANWRPITMLVFVSLIVARWLGFTAPNMTEAEYIAVYDIIQLGLGGYIIGRSAEKVAPRILEAVKK